MKPKAPVDKGPPDEDKIEMLMPFIRPAPTLAVCALGLIAACEQPADFDLRGLFGNAPSTSEAAQTATADRPEPDDRGVISYPSYQVAVARRGDTVEILANRIGTDAGELARFNGMLPNDLLREGEVVALPTRVAEPVGAIDVTAIAGTAIDEADAESTSSSTTQPGPATDAVEPIRHKVERGETAFTIARLYNVSVRSLSEWNGLDADFTIREGQYLLIPVVLPGAPLDVTELPGEGSETPEPPSASDPLPEDDTVAASEPVVSDVAPEIGQSEPVNSGRMAFPVRGDIIREYSKGKNDGIDIAAAPGTAVKAAADGFVAAITTDTNGIPIIVVKHPDNLLTVYSNVGNLKVIKGTTVSRGQKLAEIRSEGTAALHFEVRDGFESVDPMPYLQ